MTINRRNFLVLVTGIVALPLVPVVAPARPVDAWRRVTANPLADIQLLADVIRNDHTYSPILIMSEDMAIRAFGEGSELSQVYRELKARGEWDSLRYRKGDNDDLDL